MTAARVEIPCCTPSCMFSFNSHARVVIQVPSG